MRQNSLSFKKFEKEPNRKAVFRSFGGPKGVLLPFLAEDLYLYTITGP
jgi:hypothetical protein